MRRRQVVKYREVQKAYTEGGQQIFIVLRLFSQVDDGADLEVFQSAEVS